MQRFKCLIRKIKYEVKSLDEGCDNLASHVEVGEDVEEKEDGPGRLGDDEEVDQAVEDTGRGEH